MWDDPTMVIPFLSILFGMVFVSLFMVVYFKKHNLM